MSNECSTIVWKRDFGNANRKCIAARLADHADDEGRGIWPSVERVAAQCNTSPRTVQRVLSAFVEEGILKIVSEGGKGPGSTRRYDFNMAKIEALPLAKWGPDAAPAEPDDGGEAKGDTVSPLENDGEAKGDSQSAKGDKPDEKGCHGVTQTTIEPPVEPSLSQDARKRAEREGGNGPEDQEDDRRSQAALDRRYWKLVRNHPQSSGVPKSSWKREWLKLSADEQDRAELRHPVWLELMKRQKRDHIAALSTYFAEKLFDEVDDPKPVVAVRAAEAYAPPFGPAWAVAVYRELIGGPVDCGPCPITREGRQATFAGMVTMWGEEKARARAANMGYQFDASGALVFADDFEAEMMRRHVLANGWPVVNRLYVDASHRAGIRGSSIQALEAFSHLMEPVPVGSERFIEWKVEHQLRNWPWLPDTGAQRVVYFPAGEPVAALDAFAAEIKAQEAVSGANRDIKNEGKTHDGGGRQAAE